MESTTTSNCHLPYWKAGSGYYGDTLGQKSRKILSSCIDLVLSFIDTVPVQEKGVFTMADYGTNDGYSSMPLISSVIEHLRKKYGEDLTIQIIYEDQEKNDFNSLFNRLSDDSSYLSRFSNVYTFATNVNFYKRCVPNSSCDVIFTSMATLLMEKLDMNFKDCVFEFFATEEERERFRVEADRDWTKFLLLRAKELKPEGLLVVVDICSSSYYNVFQREIAPMASDAELKEEIAHFDVFHDLDIAWRQLKDDKMITQEEYERCSAKLRLRNAEEIKSSFEREDSGVQQAGLRLVHYDEFDTSCVFKDLWREHKKTTTDENRAFFANTLVTAYRVPFQTIFQSSLSGERTEMEKRAIVEELYRRFHSLVMSKHPETYRSDGRQFRLVARKQ